jgi:UvrD-like helicase C-terminal domain
MATGHLGAISIIDTSSTQLCVRMFYPPVLIRLLHHVRLPQVPRPGRVAGLAVAQRAFSGRDVIHRSPERERDRLHAGVLVGEDGARGRDPDIRPDHDIAVAVAELTISRRQQGVDRTDAQLAAIFSGRSNPAGEDEIAARALNGFEDPFLKLRRWEKAGELPGLLREIFSGEFHCGTSETAEIVAGLEQALGAKPNERGYLNFKTGCSTHAESWQILSINRDLEAGSAYLNRSIKEGFRAQRLEAAIASNNVSWKRKWFRFIKPQGPEQITHGDKVICVRNHKRDAYYYRTAGAGKENGDEKEYIANGEIGLVTGATAYGHSNPKFVNVEFAGREDRSFGFSRSSFREDGQPFLELAYAVTVHKAQGSQFGIVILILPAKSRLLSREMLYTALTRQTDRIWILHQGGFEEVLAYRHNVFSDIDARTTNLLHDTRPEPAVLPTGLPPGIAKNARGFLEDRLTHRTIRGERVSSKNELAIANILYELEQKGRLTYEVEPPLPFKDNARGRWADFRIVARGETWYWEHCGLLDKPSYRARWQTKEALYRDNGFERWSETCPSGKLIVTEDGPDRGLDSYLIHQLAGRLF